MNKRFIFFQIQACLKIIETEAVFTKPEMNNEWNVNFLLITSCSQKVTRLKLHLQNQKLTMKENVVYFFK